MRPLFPEAHDLAEGGYLARSLQVGVKSGSFADAMGSAQLLADGNYHFLLAIRLMD
jgi:hypothetical protein